MSKDRRLSGLTLELAVKGSIPGIALIAIAIVYGYVQEKSSTQYAAYPYGKNTPVVIELETGLIAPGGQEEIEKIEKGADIDFESIFEQEIISPDGKWIAFTQENLETYADDLYIKSSDGAQVFTITDYQMNVHVDSVKWTDDSNFLLLNIYYSSGPHFISYVRIPTFEVSELADTRPLNGTSLTYND